MFDETLNYLQDFRGDVIGLAAPKDGILEHVRYGPTGRPEAFPAADVNFDGVVDDDDQADIDAAIKAFKLDNGDYDPRADLNRDGKVDGGDETLFLVAHIVHLSRPLLKKSRPEVAEVFEFHLCTRLSATWRVSSAGRSSSFWNASRRSGHHKLREYQRTQGGRYWSDAACLSRLSRLDWAY
ncbi:MAG: hypothetical protein QM783_07345 [Phycisphaerales bacterium]